MGYIEKNLMVGEKVLYIAKLHGIVYVPTFLASIVVWALVIAVPSVFVFAVAFFFFICCVIWLIEKYGGTQYVLTTSRVIVKTGIIKRKVNELMLRKCEGIQVEQSILGRILSYGTLKVTTGEQTNSYKMIKNPVKFSTRINEQIEALYHSK